MRKRKPEIDRFLPKYDKDPISGCWLWKAGISKSGYGKFHAGDRTVPAHRWAFEYFVAKVPDDLVMDHLCNVRHCVNPQHLRATTHRQNILRGNGPPAKNARKSHCKRGHLLSGSNLIPNKRGERRCRKCIDAHHRAYVAKRRETRIAQ